jgi:dTDP-4-dehydrorhamnose reductase
MADATPDAQPTSNARPRLLLIGSGGQLGQVLAAQLPAQAELESLSHAQLDLADPDAVRTAVRDSFAGLGPQIVVNAAAYTAVDKAEQEPELAFAVNATAPAIIAEELARTNGWLVHYSTDYVFDGSGAMPWRETDPTGPLGVYGASKLAGEQAIAATRCCHVILRTSWVYAAVGRNFLHTMLRLGRERELLRIVDDQVGAPTSAGSLAAATEAVLGQIADQNAMSGVYHLACAGETSWAGFAQAIFAAFAAIQKPPQIVPIATSEYPTPARRPLNSRLNCEKFAVEFGYHMPQWQAALAHVANTILAQQR